MRNRLPSVSVVIEWENVRLSEMSRARAMLKALGDQLAELTSRMALRPEIILLHDEDMNVDQLRRILAESWGKTDETASIQLRMAGDRTYYEQKNLGVAEAKNEIVLFVDSDVIPEPGWLAALLEPFSDSKIKAVSGAAYIEPTSFYGRAFALFWFFPLRQERDDIVKTDNFFANNVAFRRDVIRNYPFPDMDTFRGQCSVLARMLDANDVTLWRAYGARVSHPPPNGFRHFVSRALCQGHDTRKLIVGEKPNKLRGAWEASKERARQSYWTIAKRRGDLGMSKLEAAGAFTLACVYYSLFAVGYVLADRQAPVIRRLFPV